MSFKQLPAFECAAWDAELGISCIFPDYQRIQAETSLLQTPCTATLAQIQAPAITTDLSVKRRFAIRDLVLKPSFST